MCVVGVAGSVSRLRELTREAQVKLLRTSLGLFISCAQRRSSNNPDIHLP